MKRIILILLLLAASQSLCAGKGRDRQLPEITYDSIRACWQGDSLQLRFRARIAGRLPRGGRYIGLIPKLGETTFPAIGYFRPTEARYFRRRQFFDPQQTPEMAHTVLARRGNDVHYVNYEQSLLMPSTPSDSVLLIKTRLFTCCSSTLKALKGLRIPLHPGYRRDTVYIYDNRNDRLPLPVAVVSLPLYEANVTFLEPQPEAVKERTASATVRLTYPVNVSRVLSYFGDNATELHHIDSILNRIATDTATYRITRIAITGYASPEDTYEHNLHLSERRAYGMRDWLADNYGLDRNTISCQGAGEDWDGLRALVAASDLSFRDEVLAIIDRYDLWHGREKHLMELHGGRTYNYLLTHFFPTLRRMELEMEYSVRSFTPDESADRLTSHPQDLSLQEIYDVARERNTDQTIARERDQYGKEYDIAVRYFPDDVSANINAASAALVRGDLEQARECLEQVADDPMAANNLGIYYWLCGDTAMAEQYFRKAMETDPVRAAHNLSELARWLEEQQNENEASR